jgi:poly(3-hydroxybutyrate) depolymerase
MLVARREVAINGVQRLYLLAVPPEYDASRPYPLVFGFHGSGGDREQLRGYMNVEAPAAGQAIFIYPEGLVVNDGATGWELSNESDDLTFVDTLLAQYESELCIDEKRVFATGHSFGGCMSNTVGCYRGTEFRAIAPVAGCSGGGRNTTCSGRIASLQIHSPKDTSTDYGGAIGACTRYLRANTCDEMPACGCHYVDGLEDPSDECVQQAQEPYSTSVSLVDAERDEQPAVARSYLGCDPGYPVVFVDHWRREREEVGDPSERWHNPPPWTGALIWEFFSGLPIANLE